MKDGIGKDDTREDHPRVTSQLYASYARALEVRNLASIIGPEDLSESDRYLTFAKGFEQRFVGQGEDEDRSIIETLNIAWELLSLLPAEGLFRVSEEDIDKYHHWQSEDQATVEEDMATVEGKDSEEVADEEAAGQKSQVAGYRSEEETSQ